MNGGVVCVGASVRALAASAAAAGLRPVCFDLFADADLRAICEQAGGRVTRVEAFDDRLLAAIAQTEARAVVFSGAMENRPTFVDAVAATHPVWGPTGHLLRRCRDPHVVQAAAARAGLTPLAVSDRQPSAGDWLWKPLASAGGVDFDRPECGRPGYWQERARGRPASVQLIDGLAFGVAWHLSPPPHADLAADGRIPVWAEDVAALVGELRLPGVCGVDVMIDDRDRPRVLEVNPRYTASMELTERLTGLSILAAAAGRDSSTSPPVAGVLGKRTVFAERSMRLAAGQDLTNAGVMVADVPVMPASIAAGEPVCTVLARAPSIEALPAALDAAAAAVRRVLTGGHPVDEGRHGLAESLPSPTV